jgi:hypothetical protein
MASGFLALVYCGCFPYHAPTQLPIPQDPLSIVDVGSRQSIDAVLVIPRYSGASGISTAAGHGPGAMNSTFFIAHPFVYHQGQPFAPVQPKSSGVVWGWFWGFTGTGTTLDGVLLVAPGYESQWFSDLWSRGAGQRVALKPLPAGEAFRELRDLQRLLALEIINGPSRERFSLGGDNPIYVRLSAEERNAADAFLTEGLARQGAVAGAGASNGRKDLPD